MTNLKLTNILSQYRLFLIAAALAPLVMQLYFPGFFYGNAAGWDNWLYLLPKTSLLDGNFKVAAWAYFGERLPALLPQYTLYRLFPYEVARPIGLLIPFYIILVSFYLLTKRIITNRLTSSIMTFIFCWSPLIVAGTTHDYVAFQALAYLVASLYLFFAAKDSIDARKSRQLALFFFSGLFFSAGILSNPRMALYTFFLFPLFIFQLDQFKTARMWIADLTAWSLGSLTTFLICGAFYHFVLNLSFIFFNDTIRVIMEGDSFMLEHSFAEAVKRVSGMALFWSALGAMLIVTIKRCWTPLIASIALNLIFLFFYAASGANYLVSSNYAWPYFLFMVLVAAIIQTKKIDPSVSILSILIAPICLPIVFFRQDFPQIIMFEYLGVGSIVIFLLIGVLIAWRFRSRNLVLVNLTALAIISFATRPHLHYGGHNWTTRIHDELSHHVYSSNTTGHPSLNSNADEYKRILNYAKTIHQFNRDGIFWTHSARDLELRNTCVALKTCFLVRKDFDISRLMRDFRSRDINKPQTIYFIGMEDPPSTEYLQSYLPSNMTIALTDSVRVIDGDNLYLHTFVVIVQ